MGDLFFKSKLVLASLALAAGFALWAVFSLQGCGDGNGFFKNLTLCGVQRPASLDSQTRNNLQGFLLSLWQKKKVTIIFVTHNVDEAVFLSDEVLVFSKRPARIIARFDISSPRPRERTSTECNQMRKMILDALKAEKMETS